MLPCSHGQNQKQGHSVIFWRKKENLEDLGIALAKKPACVREALNVAEDGGGQNEQS